MQIQAKKSNTSLIVGVLIGSVVGLALGALVTSLVNRFASRVWPKVNQPEQPHSVDPRWLLQ